MAEGSDHCLPDHRHKCNTHENAYVEFAAFQMRDLGIHEFYHEPEEEHGPEGRDNALLDITGENINYVPEEKPNDAERQTNKRIPA